MVAIVVIFICLVAFAAIKGYEYLKKQAFVAKIVDGEDTTSNFIRAEAQNVINLIRDKENNKIKRNVQNILLSDGQEISYLVNDINAFKKFSLLKFAPTDTEWEILREVVKKSYNLY